MPIYEYKCNNCGKTIELIVNIHEINLECPYCKSKDLKKLLTSPSMLRIN